MGKIYNKFSKVELTSESSVEQKFIFPFLIEYLGYQANDIIPQRHYKPVNVPFNRNKMIPEEFLDAIAIPDYSIVDENERVLFILEAKKPEEDLSDYEDQLYGYAVAVRVNLIVITNGNQFDVYYGTEKILECKNLEEIDTQFNSIKTLLHKKNQGKPAQFRIYEHGKEVNQKTIISLSLSDYSEYLKRYSDLNKNIIVLGEDLPRITDYNLFHFRIERNQYISLDEVISDFILHTKNNRFILKGVSGVGKTEFVNYLISYLSNLTLKQESYIIPVNIELINWQNNSSIIQKIKHFINVDGIKEEDIEKSLRDGHFVLFFDSLDEFPQHSSDSFFRALSEVEKLYPNNCYILISKPGFDLRRVESDRDTIWIDPPELDNLREYINSILKNTNFETFLKELEKRKLESLAQTPIMLNYLIIYFNNLGNFPRSKFELLEDLINDYFGKFIGKKFNEIKDFNIIKEVLSLIAYHIIFKNNDSFISKVVVNKIIISYLKKKREDYEILEEIKENQILDFLLKFNFLRKEDENYLFWHQILLEYFSALEFIITIKDSNTSLKLKELFHNFKVKEIITIVQPLIKDEKFNNVLKNENIFLFIQSHLQRTDISDDLRDLIKKILLEKLESKYSIIKRISMELINDFLFKIDDKITFFADILIKSENPEIIKWVLDSIGHIGTKKAYLFLIGLVESYEDTYVRDSFERYPLKQFLLIPLSNFDDPEVQDIFINEIKKKWRGVNYLKVLGEALENIAKRSKLTKQSIDKILKIYSKPPEFEPKLRFSSHIRVDALERVLISIHNELDLTKFFLKIIKEEFKARSTWGVERLCGKTLNTKHIDFILEEIKNIKNDLEYRNSLANVIRYSKEEVDFNKIINILQYLRQLGVDPKRFDLNLIRVDYKKFKVFFPEYEMSYIFHLILEHLLNHNDIEEFNQEKLLVFLKNYLMYPHELVLNSVYRLVAKYNIRLLLEQEKVFLNRSMIEYLKPTINYNLEKAIRLIQGYFERHIKEPDDYHDHLLMDWMIELLLDVNQVSVAIKLFNKYLDGPAKVENIAYTLNVLERFPSDYSISVLRKVKQKIIDSDVAEMHRLVFNLRPIDNPEYVKFCLELAEMISDWNINSVFSNMTFIKPYEFEKEIITFLQRKISEGDNLVGALNVLFYIGTQDSIEFLSKFLDSDNELLRNKAFACIKYIHERNNYLWYNNEEKYQE